MNLSRRQTLGDDYVRRAKVYAKDNGVDGLHPYHAQFVDKNNSLRGQFIGKALTDITHIGDRTTPPAPIDAVYL